MNLGKKQNLIIVIAITIIVLAFSVSNYISKQKVYVLSDWQKNDTTEAVDKGQNDVKTYENNVEKIVVHVEGEVVSPGVYELNKDTRVFDAIEAAGGLLETADRKKVNLAKKIVDEEYIYIYSVKDILSEDDKEFNNITNVHMATTNNKNQTLLNINKANATELQMLPGIGQVLADRIIEYRMEKGNFNTVEDLKNVSGIGDKKFEDIKEKITVR